MFLRQCAWLVFALLIIAGYSVVLHWQGDVRAALKQWDAARARANELPIPVKTHRVSQESVADVIGATCVTRPYSSAPLYPSMTNPTVQTYRLSRVLVREGDVIKKGDVLFELDESSIRLVVDKENANVKMLDAHLKAYQDLRRDGAASDSDVQFAEMELTEAKLAREMAQQDLTHCVVRSPVDGVIDNVELAEGVLLNSTAELATVYRLDPIVVTMDFPVERLGDLEMGQQAEVVLDSYPNEKFTGEVVGVAANAATQTRVIHAYIEVANPELRIRGGVTGYCRLTPDAELVTAVPRVAVIRRKGKAMVMGVEGDRAYARPIEVGAMVREGLIEVRSGLEVGEEIVIFGHDTLEEGDEVNADWREWSRRDNNDEIASAGLPL